MMSQDRFQVLSRVPLDFSTVYCTFVHIDVMPFYLYLTHDNINLVELEMVGLQFRFLTL